jgi:hypothetical protein
MSDHEAHPKDAAAKGEAARAAKEVEELLQKPTLPELRAVLYLGAALVILTTLSVGVGLLRAPAS